MKKAPRSGALISFGLSRPLRCGLRFLRRLFRRRCWYFRAAEQAEKAVVGTAQGCVLAVHAIPPRIKKATFPAAFFNVGSLWGVYSCFFNRFVIRSIASILDTIREISLFVIQDNNRQTVFCAMSFNRRPIFAFDMCCNPFKDCIKIANRCKILLPRPLLFLFLDPVFVLCAPCSHIFAAFLFGHFDHLHADYTSKTTYKQLPSVNRR